jgi:hypothetical protein
LLTSISISEIVEAASLREAVNEAMRSSKDGGDSGWYCRPQYEYNKVAYMPTIQSAANPPDLTNE